MLKALNELSDFKIAYDINDDDTAEETIIYLYLAIRLKPLLGVAKIDGPKINNIADILADHYFDREISLDLLINVVYNYINTHKKCPSERILSDDIEALLKEYAEIEWKH